MGPARACGLRVWTAGLLRHAEHIAKARLRLIQPGVVTQRQRGQRVALRQDYELRNQIDVIWKRLTIPMLHRSHWAQRASLHCDFLCGASFRSRGDRCAAAAPPKRNEMQGLGRSGTGAPYLRESRSIARTRRT